MTDDHVVAQHDHLITFSGTTGTLWLQVAFLGSVLVVVAFVLLKPFADVSGDRVRVAVTATAAAAGYLTLLLADGIDLSKQVILLLLIGLSAPVLFTTLHGRWPGRVVRSLHRAAPLVLLVAAAGCGTEFARAWIPGFTVREVEVGVLLHTGLAVGLVGLSWVALCRPKPHIVGLGTHILGWVLANAVLGGLTHAALLAIA